MNLDLIFLIGHLVGVALGVGGATVADILFMKEIGSDKLSSKGLDTLKTMSVIIWLGALFLVASGIGFIWLHQMENPGSALIYSEKLAAKLIIVGIVIVNGLVLNLKVTPLLETAVGKPNLQKFILTHGTLFFTTAAISVTSWYSALVIGAIRIRGLAFEHVLGIYLVVLIIAILISNMGGRMKFSRHK